MSKDCTNLSTFILFKERIVSEDTFIRCPPAAKAGNSDSRSKEKKRSPSPNGTGADDFCRFSSPDDLSKFMGSLSTESGRASCASIFRLRG